MKKDQQIATVFRIYHGDKQAHIMGHAEKFMKGVSEYVDIMVNEGTGVTLWDDTTDKDGVAREVILEMLHRQFGKILVAGDNITHDFLFKTYESKDKLVTARAAIRVAKKMMSLMRDAVKEHVCEFRDWEYYYPSGRNNKHDFDDWMLKKMFNCEANFGASGGSDPVPMDVNVSVGSGLTVTTADTEEAVAEEEEEDAPAAVGENNAVVDSGMEGTDDYDPEQVLLRAAYVMDTEDDHWNSDNITHRGLRGKAQLMLEILTTGMARLNLPQDQGTTQIKLGKILLENQSKSAEDIMRLAIAKYGVHGVDSQFEFENGDNDDQEEMSNEGDQQQG
jgi:hypothetical protein